MVDVCKFMVILLNVWKFELDVICMHMYLLSQNEFSVKVSFLMLECNRKIKFVHVCR